MSVAVSEIKRTEEPGDTTGAPAVRRGAFQIPSLDGLRAVSFGVVFLAHASLKRWIPGDLGLLVFFFLSGYLITTLLRMEYDETGRINFRDFYLRRVLRIFPPFYLVLLLAYGLCWSGLLNNPPWPQSVLAQAGHLTNYWIVRHGWWDGVAPGTWVYWSLAVEEHFYLLFPLLYLGMRRRGWTGRQQGLALGGLCAAVLLWRCALVFGLHASHERLYVATDTRLDGILFGCLLAVYANPALDVPRLSERRLRTVWLPLGLVVLLCSFAVRSFAFQHTVSYTLGSLALVPIFTAAIRYPWWGAFRWLNARPVRFVGLLSFSLYLLHETALEVFRYHHWRTPLVAPAALAVSLALATAIHYGVERPCARLRKRLSHVSVKRIGGGGSGAGGGPAPTVEDAPETGQSRIARNVLATLGTQLLSWGLTFAVTLYLPGYVGDAGLGKLAFAASLATLFGVVVPLGTSTLLVKEIARDRARTGELMLAALILRLPLAALMTGLAVLVVHLLGYSAQTRLLVTVSALGMGVGTVGDVFAAALQGREDLTRQSLGVLINKFLGAALTIGLIVRHAPLWAIAAVGIWTGLASLLVYAQSFRPLLPTLRRPSVATVRGIALAGLPFLGWTVFQTLYGQTDPVVLKIVTNDATVGWYAAAFRLVGTTLFLPTALSTALLPTLSRLHREDMGEFRLLARRMLGLIMLCGVPIALVLLLLPDRLVALLHYPAGFRHSIPVLRVGGVGVLLWFAGGALGTTIFASDGQARMFRTAMMASLLGIPACFIGAYVGHHVWHNGAVGAISSDVVLETFLLWSYLRLLPAGTFNGESLRLIGRCALASLPMAALLAFLSAQGWGLWSLLPCTLVYLAMCVALRCLRVQDLAMARQVLARKAA